MKVLVCGSRYYTNAEKIWSKLNALHFEFPFNMVVIEGEAKGADIIARQWAENNLPVNCLKKFPAQWKRYGRGAGPMRNQQMLDEGKPDLVLAFGGKDGTGTNDMVRRAKKAGIPVREYDRD